MLRPSSDKSKSNFIKSLEINDEIFKKDNLTRAKSKNDIQISAKTGIKSLKILPSIKNNEENQVLLLKYDDSFNYGIDEDNIINNMKYKDLKFKSRQNILNKSSVKKVQNTEGDLFRNEYSDLDSPYQGDDKFDLDIAIEDHDILFKNEKSQRKTSFQTLDKSIFVENSPIKHNKHNLDDDFSSQGRHSSSGKLFDYLDSNSNTLKKFTLIESIINNDSKTSLQNENKNIPTHIDRVEAQSKKENLKFNIETDLEFPSPKNSDINTIQNMNLNPIRSGNSQFKKVLSFENDKGNLPENNNSPQRIFDDNLEKNKHSLDSLKKIDPAFELNPNNSSLTITQNKSIENPTPNGQFFECEIDLTPDINKLNMDQLQNNVNSYEKKINTSDNPEEKNRFKILTINRTKTGHGCTITLKKITSENSILRQKLLPESINNQTQIENIFNEFPRRSLREKRERPKDFEGNEYNEGFTFVDYKIDKQQKYKITLSLKALLMMNLHSHLSKFEVIGILGGKIIENELIILEALPCKNIAASSNHHSVEMDPTSQVESHEKLEKIGLLALGWYHSHPTFKTTPSQIDQTTHTTHQACYRDLPYLGIIIGPYSNEKGASKTKGDIFVFNVKQNQTFKLSFRVLPSPFIPKCEIEEMKKIIEQTREANRLIKFNDLWFL